MRRLTPCALFIVLAGLSWAQEPKNDWHKVTGDGDKAEIQFPAKPKEGEKKGSSDFYLDRESGKAALMMQSNPLDKAFDISSAAAVKRTLDNGRIALVNALKGKLVSEKEFKFSDKFPARDIDVEAPGLGLYRVRFIVTPGLFYQVTVLGPKDYVEGAEAKKFIESFKLKETEEPKK